MKIPVGVSNHHVHLTKEDFEVLFGAENELHVKRNLSQKGEFACEETVDIECNDYKMEHIKIIGPFRKYTQVELLDCDKDILKIKPPYRNSGDLSGSESVTLIGPKGKLLAKESTIIANNHIHMSDDDLKYFGKKAYDKVDIVTKDGIVIKDLIIKSDPSCKLEMHINKDDALKNKLENYDEVEIC